MLIEMCVPEVQRHARVESSRESIRISLIEMQGNDFIRVYDAPARAGTSVVYRQAGLVILRALEFFRYI